MGCLLYKVRLFTSSIWRGGDLFPCVVLFICSNFILFVYFSSFSFILLFYLMWFVYFVRLFTSSIWRSGDLFSCVVLFICSNTILFVYFSSLSFILFSPWFGLFTLFVCLLLSVSGWLKDSDHELIRRVSLRIEDVTGLTMDTAEELQVWRISWLNDYKIMSSNQVWRVSPSEENSVLNNKSN